MLDEHLFDSRNPPSTRRTGRSRLSGAPASRAVVTPPELLRDLHRVAEHAPHDPRVHTVVEGLLGGAVPEGTEDLVADQGRADRAEDVEDQLPELAVAHLPRVPRPTSDPPGRTVGGSPRAAQGAVSDPAVTMGR